MKKFIALTSLLIGLVLTACSAGITVPDFVGQDYGDVVVWAKDNDVNIVVSSEYNDDVEPNSVISQGIEPGETVQVDGDLEIVYSRGYNPDTIIVVPDFTGKSEQDIIDWLVEEDISKYSFIDAFNDTVPVGDFVRTEVTNTEDRDTVLRKDTYTFIFSRGPLVIEEVDFNKPGTIRGVNLGGWFVLESWMKPELFEGTQAHDETSFWETVDNAADILDVHWDTFITEDDFEFLSDHGVNYVRLPIPWWLWGEEFSYTHEGVTHDITYGASIQYIERAMVWAENHNIKVLLDLHTAPGGQNGFDNGGISGVLQWPREENVAKTVEIIERIAQHFSQYNSLWGIEVLNEPGWGVNLDILMDFYVDSYIAIRKHNADVWIGFHDGFRMYMESEWGYFFRHNDFHNVFFDIHLYQTFGDHWSNFDIHDHLEWVAVEQDKAVRRYNGLVPTVVGEWSLGLQGNVYEGLDQESIKNLKIAYGNAQLNVYEQGMGWFFWNYKIEQGTHTEWDMVRLIEQGIFPSDFSDPE